MDKKKVYIGYNNKLKRCLLYKKNEKEYLDLEDAKLYKEDDLLDDSLISYDDLIKCKGLSTKHNLMKSFKKDQDEQIPLNELFIGDISEVTGISDIVESKEKIDVSPLYQLMYAYCFKNSINYKDAEYIPLSVSYKCHTKVLYPNRLLRRIETKYADGHDYLDLLTGAYFSYTDKLLQKGDIIVNRNLKTFSEVFDISKNIFSNETKLRKNKILSIYIKDRFK